MRSHNPCGACGAQHDVEDHLLEASVARAMAAEPQPDPNLAEPKSIEDLYCGGPVTVAVGVDQARGRDDTVVFAVDPPGDWLNKDRRSSAPLNAVQVSQWAQRAQRLEYLLEMRNREREEAAYARALSRPPYRPMYVGVDPPPPLDIMAVTRDIARGG